MRTAYILIAAVAAAAVTAWWIVGNQPYRDDTTPTNTAFERIMQTGVIRCGYIAWDPMLKVDPTTKQVSGIAHDVFEAAAGYLGLKVEWTKELTWGEFPLALQNNRIDAFCMGSPTSAERARATLQTDPFLFTQFVVAVLSDDARLINNPQNLNKPETTFGQVDGTASVKMMRQAFPSATQVGYPESIPLSQLLLDVGAGKIDATFMAKTMVAIYNQSHPGRLVGLDAPGVGRFLPNVMFVSPHEPRLRDMLNVALNDVLDTGLVGQAVARHQIVPDAYRLPDAPYQTNK